MSDKVSGLVMIAMAQNVETKPLIVFVSYCRADDNKTIATFFENRDDLEQKINSELNNRLKYYDHALQVKFWVDDSIQKKAGEWTEMISDALDKSYAMLSFVSTRYCRSRECLREYNGFVSGTYQMYGDPQCVEEKKTQRDVIPVFCESVGDIRDFNATDELALQFASRLGRMNGFESYQYFNHVMSRYLKKKPEDILIDGIVALVVDAIYKLLPKAQSARTAEPVPPADEGAVGNDRAPEASSGAGERDARSGIGGIDVSLLPQEGSEFYAALFSASEPMLALYGAIMRYIDSMPCRVGYEYNSRYTSFAVKNSNGKKAIFGSVCKRANTHIEVYLKPGRLGFGYGAGGSELRPRESSPDGLFRNVTKMGHWGSGNLEVKLTPDVLENGELPKIVRDAILDAARTAYDPEAFPEAESTQAVEPVPPADEVSVGNDRAPEASSGAGERGGRSGIGELDARFLPKEGSKFEAALAKASGPMMDLYITVMHFVDSLPYKVDYKTCSTHTSFLLTSAGGKGAIFGSVCKRANTRINVNLKPGRLGFGYGAGGSELEPRESSPDGLFRNVRGMGFWGNGYLEVNLTPDVLENGELPEIVRDAILDAARAAYES